jgi:hypothetical protein
MLRRSFALCLFILFMQFLEEDVYAVQGEVEGIIIHEILRVNFTPLEGYFFCELLNGEVHRFKAVLFSSENEATQEKSLKAGTPRPEGSLKKTLKDNFWLAGVMIPEAYFKQVLEYSVIVVGDKGRYSFIPPKPVPPRIKDNLLDAVVDTEFSFTNNAAITVQRLAINQKQEKLKGLEQEMEILSKKIVTLKADVDTISDMEKIVDAKQSLKKELDDLKNAEHDMTSLSQFIAQVKTVKEPTLFNQREIELTTQLSELATLAKSVELQEVKIRNSSEAKRKQQLVDLVKRYTPEGMERVLFYMKRKRAELEDTLRRQGVTITEKDYSQEPMGPESSAKEQISNESQGETKKEGGIAQDVSLSEMPKNLQ